LVTDNNNKREGTKMKTIEDKGSEYQIGAVYEFSDNKRHWYIDTLEDIHQEDAFPYKAQWGDYKFIRVCEVIC